MTSAKGVGMPIKLLHESEGHIITVRLLIFRLPCGESGASALAPVFSLPARATHP